MKRALVVLCAIATRAHAEEPRLWAQVERLAARLALVDEQPRAYSVPARPRDLSVGAIALSCEHQQGRPCGRGIGILGEVDAAAGYGSWLTGFVRLQGNAGSHDEPTTATLDRAFLRSRLGPLRLQLGRDVLRIGPGVHTQLAWSDHAAPLDHVRISTRALAITDAIHGSLHYILGRLRAPQQFPGTLVSIARGELAIGRVQLGFEQLLQLGGDGAPALGLWGFIAEHFRRADVSAGPTDSSNRRIGADIAISLDGARLYYELVLEDARKRFHDALHYDADHLLGITTRRLTIELLRTGVRSQEHFPRYTGFSNAGRLTGSSLGPDAIAAYASTTIPIRCSQLSPWLELARLSSDTYTFVMYGPIDRATEGVAEHRYRLGAQLRAPLRAQLHVELDAMYEHVGRFGYVAGHDQNNVALFSTFVWQATQ